MFCSTKTQFSCLSTITKIESLIRNARYRTESTLHYSLRQKEIRFACQRIEKIVISFKLGVQQKSRANRVSNIRRMPSEFMNKND